MISEALSWPRSSDDNDQCIPMEIQVMVDSCSRNNTLFRHTQLFIITSVNMSLNNRKRIMQLIMSVIYLSAVTVACEKHILPMLTFP